MEYPWYDVVDGDDLAQGDFIDSCPIIIPPPSMNEDDTINANVCEYDVVIMSQSCDLENRKIDLVLLCPVWPLSKFEERSSFFKSKKGKEELRRGNTTGYHLLNECNIENFKREFSVVDFRNAYSVSINFLIDLVQERGERLRLLPPYREHLSQNFARFFMRVGLPDGIPPFK